MNTTKTAKKQTKRNGVKFGKNEPINTPSKKTPSKLNLSRKALVEHWKNENLKPSKICDFFHNSKEITQNFINEVNNSFNTSFKISSLNKSLLALGYSYEKNSVELSENKTLIIKDKKQYFSANYMLMLLQRKAKYSTAKNPEFIKHAEEMQTRKALRMIEAEAKKALIAKLLKDNESK